MPSGMSGSDNSIAESLPPPPNLGRGRLIAPFRIGANAPNQNSAGRYPLISRPMQISTRVGVVQAIGRLPKSFLVGHNVEWGGPPRKPPQHAGGSADAAYLAREFYCRCHVGLPVMCRAAYHRGEKGSSYGS